MQRNGRCFGRRNVRLARGLHVLRNQRFIELARSVYQRNDRRAAIKRRINQRLGSEIIEEKSYRPTEPAQP